MKNLAVNLAIWLLRQKYVMPKRATVEDALYVANHELRHRNQEMHREIKRLRLAAVVKNFQKA